MWSWTVSFLWVHTQLFSSRAQHSYFKHTGPSLLMGVMHKRVAVKRMTVQTCFLFQALGIKREDLPKLALFLLKYQEQQTEVRSEGEK